MAAIRRLERVMGIEPTQPAWEAGTLPLSYTRTLIILYKKTLLFVNTYGHFSSFKAHYYMLGRIFSVHGRSGF
jgi:hypothetical protein